MADFAVQIKGLAEFKKALEQLPKKIAGKVLADAVKAGANLVRDAARAKVRRFTGAVANSIVAYRDRASTNDRAIYDVGVTMKKKYPRRYRVRGSIRLGGRKVLKNPAKEISDVNWPAFWWRFLEFPAKGKPRLPFLVPAWQERQRAAMAEIIDRLGTGIAKAAQEVKW